MVHMTIHMTVGNQILQVKFGTRRIQPFDIFLTIRLSDVSGNMFAPASICQVANLGVRFSGLNGNCFQRFGSLMFFGHGGLN